MGLVGLIADSLWFIVVCYGSCLDCCARFWVGFLFVVVWYCGDAFVVDLVVSVWACLC